MLGVSPEEPFHHQKKKRVGKACDLCRIKKTKCDGKNPCSRCVANNKICAFVHKKRNKDKVHPSGYIEMLETRVELLTKSLEKLMVLSEPHLPFLQDIIATAKLHKSSPGSLPLSERTEDNESYIPINEVVAYLVKQELPVVALDLEPRLPDQDPDDGLGDTVAKGQLFGKLEPVPILTSNGGTKVESSMEVLAQPDLTQFAGLDQSRRSSSALVFSPSNDRMRGHAAKELGAETKGAFAGSSSRDFLNLKLPEMNAVLEAALQPGLQASLEPGLESSLEPGLDLNPSMQAVDTFHRRSNLMFINNYSPSSTSHLPVSSLSNKFEGHYLDELSINSIRRLVSQKTHQRKNSGHVYKPSYASHSNLNFSTSSFFANNGNVFHSLSSNTILSPTTFPSEVDEYSQEDVKRINDEDYFELASEKVRNQPPSLLVENDLSSYLDADILLSNPFLS